MKYGAILRMKTRSMDFDALVYIQKAGDCFNIKKSYEEFHKIMSEKIILP